MFRNIIWDVDGTLFDTYPLIAAAFRAAINALGKDAPLDWIESLSRKSFGFCTEMLAKKYKLSPEIIRGNFERHYAQIPPEDNPPITGVLTICNYILTINGKNLIVTHRSSKGTEALLAAHQMKAYFSGWLGSDDGYPRKPDPTVFEATLQQHNLKKEETITVGDRDIDILAGQAAGVFSCFYGDPPSGIKPDLVIQNFAELYQFLVNCNR